MNSVESNLRKMLQQRKLSMLHIFVLLVKLLICCNLIADTANTTHAATNARTTTTAAVTSMLATASQRDMPHNWLRRQRRFLLFEEGSQLVLQTVTTKALLPERPRGLFQTLECSVIYALPTSLDELWPQTKKVHPTKQVATTTHSTTTAATAVHMPHVLTFSGSGSNSNYNNNSYDETWLPTWHATADEPAVEETMTSWGQVPARRRHWHSAHKQQKQQQLGKQQYNKQQQEKIRKQKQQQQHSKQYNVRQEHRFPLPWQQAKSFTFTPSILSRKIPKFPVAAHPAAHQLSVCPRRNVYGSWQDNVPHWCAAGTKMFGRSRRQSSVGYGDNGGGVADGKKSNEETGHRIDERADEFHFATNAESVFFDLLAQWAHIYNYPPHYCIMRTFCESRHLLAPRGQSLFHDMLRILIDAALPAARRHATYKKAISHDNLSDCAQYYATLCGLSFLQHFNEVVHGRFM